MDPNGESLAARHNALFILPTPHHSSLPLSSGPASRTPEGGGNGKKANTRANPYYPGEKPGTSHSEPGQVRSLTPTSTSTRPPSPGSGQTFIPEAQPLRAPHPEPELESSSPRSTPGLRPHFRLWSQEPPSSAIRGRPFGLTVRGRGSRALEGPREVPGGGGRCFSNNPRRSYSVPGLCQSVAMLAPASHLLSLLLVMGTGGTMPSPQVPPQGCYMAEEAGERTFRCSQAGLTAVPTGIPNDTRKLYLDANRLASVPAGAFQHLPVLEELDLSHNVLAHLSGAAFQGLVGTLRHLDLSANQLASVPVEAFAGLQIQVNLSANPWRCDCALQEVLRQVRLAPGTGTGIVCGPGARPDLVGQEFLLLAGEEELCGTGRGGARRSTDVALLVTMGGWLALVVAYLAHYVWQNRDETRRPLKRAPVLPVRSEDSSTLSTLV
ncbi:leucine-rich repeat-containing protein 3C [Eptesicus fuscus]|uniref:leucine-rich repeat-containing protein 3C n=1 Tax=Eptesicus fuscus TaxID=29078 RepID=UPI002403AD9A|nr:leucine-rich repeat-containing protein 3C [Eptesicus fuscus]